MTDDDMPGRHRAARPRASRIRRAVTAVLLLGSASVAVATWPGGAASADAPVQTGWWNYASGGGQAAPDPATPEGGLHLSVASGQITAFGAVLYSVPAGASGTLELGVANLTATPTVNPTSPTTAPQADVMACPTKDASWKSGDDQAWDTKPEYDCTRGFLGSLSADNKTLTFLVDSSAETLPGQLSLALVPVLTNGVPGVGTPAPVDMTQPYSMDIDKPSDNSLTITSGAPVSAPPPATGAATTSTSGATTTPSDSGASTAASGGSAPLPPALTGDSGAAVDSGTTPVVAPPTSATVPNTAPVAAQSSTSDRAHNAALAMLLLIGIGAVAMSSGQMQRAPRLLGGAGRHAANAGAAPAAAMPVPFGLYGQRGLGRFAKNRTEPPRPLT